MVLEVRRIHLTFLGIVSSNSPRMILDLQRKKIPSHTTGLHKQPNKQKKKT